MPLVRYELRSEHSMANPELFRSAARDDPEGLLEGVAMAGLVGIVRQLGDLAEFAAEVFRDLHEEFVSVGGRAHDLSVRVRTLEAELPAVEKSLLSEPNQLRFAYTNGADWHASIRSDQNHCTSGDLPRFVRKYYEECRGPPRLFLLDKYDGVGAGACLKRYSDPSFFKLEWASSELMKAQRAQRDKKARRDKKKGRRRKSGLPTPATTQIPARVRYGSATLEDLDTLSQLLAPTLKNEVDLSSSNQSGSNGRVTQTQSKSNLGPQTKGSEYPTQPTAVSPAPQAEGGISESLKPNAEDIEAMSPRIIREMENVGGSKIPKGTDMEDHVATPAVAPPSRDVEKMSRRADELPLSGSNGLVADRIIQLAGEGLEAAAVERASVNDSPGNPRGDAMLTGGEVPKLGNGTVSQSKLRNVFSKTSNEHHPEEDVTPIESRTPSRTVAGDAGPQEDPSRTNTGDVRGPGQLFGEAVRKNSVDAKEAHVIAARFPRQGSGKLSRGSSDLDGQDSAPAHKSERSVSSALAGDDGGFHDGRPSSCEFFTSNMVDTSEVSRSMEERMNSPPRLPPIRIEQILVQREEPPLISSPCFSTGPGDIRPSMSMMSRMSYSSALSRFSSPLSRSEPDSPLSPNSPPFNALYSPTGSPSRGLGGMAESPPGMYMSSFSPATDPSGYGNFRSEVPRLSLSPRSRSASPSWADREDFGSAPVRPPPPRPIVISMAESRDENQDESRQETRSLDSQPSHSTSPSLDLSKSDSVIFQSNEEPAVEVHAEAAGDSPDYLERVAHLEAAPEHSEGMRSPDADSEAGGSFRSSASSSPGMRGPLRSSIPSSFDNLDSGSTQPLSTGFVDLRPAESDSVDVPLEEPTLDIDDSSPIPVGEDGASERSAADASSIAVPVQHAPSSSGQAMDAAVYSLFADGEESEPSSPSGSVIIKDTPSPGSRTSDDSESEPEAHDYYASSHGPVSPRSVAHALEDVINRRESGSGDSRAHEDLIDESLESAPTNGASIQEDAGVVKSIAEHVVQAACIAPGERVEAFVSHTSVELDIPQEDPTITADVDSQKRSASNSPPDTPPGKKANIAGEDDAHEEASTLQWEGRSRPYESESRVVVAPASTSSSNSSTSSATNSPPSSPPPKMLQYGSSLRWRGRPHPEQDFSLPPNLVCHTETSSPPYSPPPASDLESPRPWDEVPELSMSPDRSRAEVYPLPDSPAPPESPVMSEAGDSASKRASSSDEDDEGAALGEVEMAETATDAEIPSENSLHVSDDVLPASEVQPEHSTFQLETSRPDLEVEHSQQSTLENVGNLDEDYEDYDVLPASEVQPKLSTFQFSSRTDLEVDHIQTLENEGNLDEDYEDYDVLPASEVQPKHSTFQFETSRPDLEVEHTQQSTLENEEGNLDEDLDEAHETIPPLPIPAPEPTEPTPAEESTTAHKDWNVMKAMSIQEPDGGQPPLEGGQSPLEGGESPLEGGESLLAGAQSPLEGGQSPLEGGESPLEGGESLLAGAQSPLEGGQSPLESGQSEAIEGKETLVRPASMINVAAIREKVNAIRSPLEGGQSEAIQGAEGKETLVRPASMISVAAILEKANAIRQAFVGSDDESDDEDWNDS